MGVSATSLSSEVDVGHLPLEASPETQPQIQYVWTCNYFVSVFRFLDLIAYTRVAPFGRRRPSLKRQFELAPRAELRQGGTRITPRFGEGGGGCVRPSIKKEGHRI